MVTDSCNHAAVLSVSGVCRHGNHTEHQGPGLRRPRAEHAVVLAMTTDLRRDNSPEMLDDGPLLGVLLEEGVEAAEEGVDGALQAAARHVQVQVEEQREEYGAHLTRQRHLRI